MAVWDGTYVWIYDLGLSDAGNLEQIAGQLKSHGARGAIVKFYDGGTLWSHLASLTPAQIVAGFHQRGCACIGYSYLYDANRDAELAGAITAITTARPDAYVFDVETEYQGVSTAAADAQLFMRGLLANIPQGFPLGLSTLPQISQHAGLPYSQFLTAPGLAPGQMAYLPQVYWNQANTSPAQLLDTTFKEQQQAGFGGIPTYPSYEDTTTGSLQPTSQQLADFLWRAKSYYGYTGTAVWNYQGLDTGGWTRVSQAAATFPDPNSQHAAGGTAGRRAGGSRPARRRRKASQPVPAHPTLLKRRTPLP
jgi:hypothetical protein